MVSSDYTASLPFIDLLLFSIPKTLSVLASGYVFTTISTYMLLSNDFVGACSSGASIEIRN